MKLNPRVQNIFFISCFLLAGSISNAQEVAPGNGRLTDFSVTPSMRNTQSNITEMDRAASKELTLSNCTGHTSGQSEASDGEEDITNAYSSRKWIFITPQKLTQYEVDKLNNHSSSANCPISLQLNMLNSELTQLAACLTSLEELILNDVTLKGNTHFHHIVLLTNLRHLYLENTQIADTQLQFVSTLLNLRILDLSATNVTDKGMRSLKGLTKMRILNLNCLVTNICLQEIQNMLYLAEIYLHNPNITKEALGYFCVFKHLKMVDLRGSQIIQEDVLEFGEKLKPNMFLVDIKKPAQKGQFWPYLQPTPSSEIGTRLNSEITTGHPLKSLDHLIRGANSLFFDQNSPTQSTHCRIFSLGGSGARFEPLKLLAPLKLLPESLNMGDSAPSFNKLPRCLSKEETTPTS